MKVKVSLEFGQVRQDWIKHSVKGSRELRQSMGRGCYPSPPISLTPAHRALWVSLLIGEQRYSLKHRRLRFSED